MPLDTLYQAETPEGIALSLRPAGLVARCLAWLIDFAIRLGLFVVGALATAALGAMGAGFLLIAYFLLEWFYPVVFELARGGATPGKRIMGLQVVMDSGLPVTPGASIVRNLLRAADFLPFLYAAGAVTLLLRRDFKRLGDLAAGTLVVHSVTVRLHGALPAADPLAPALPLSAAQQAAIVAWAGRAARLTPARFEELAVLAQTVVVRPGRPDDWAPVAPRLLGVAHWLLGRREVRR
ncbi:MAG TPA: RDD family protein [Ramlibacter sp.]